jgi:hypothetical protein
MVRAFSEHGQVVSSARACTKFSRGERNETGRTVRSRTTCGLRLMAAATIPSESRVCRSASCHDAAGREGPVRGIQQNLVKG